MREIKFRLVSEGKIVGFEHHKKGCAKFVSIMHSRDGESWHNVRYFPDSYIEHEHKDQYTGLGDIEGNEIYEGDILEMHEEAKVCPNEKLIVEHDEYCTYYLRRQHDRAYVAELNEGVSDFLGNYKQRHGIAGRLIGNIWQHPHLLEGGNGT